MDHDTCSARLGPYVRGELDGDDRSLVEAHLAGCADCARELVAVRALMGLEDIHLTSDERRALHQVVMAPRRSHWARWAPALGAASLLVTVAVGVAYFARTTDKLPAAIQRETDTTEAERGDGDTGTVTEDRRANEAPAGKAIAPQADTAAGTDSAGGATEAFAAEGLVVTMFANAELGPRLLTYDDAFASPERVLRRLGRDAPDRDAALQMRACAEIVQGASPYQLRPAFASVYQADGLLVMGFIFTSGTEQRYAFWGWHLGDCTRPTPIYVTGLL